MMKTQIQFTLLAMACLSGVSHAQNITVSDAWARATVPGQKATGAFMKLTAKEAATLIGASSAAAGVTEIHEMKMDKDVMKMSAIASLPLPAGQSVELKPGGYHVMLMDLKQALVKEATVPVTLHFQDAKGNKTQMELKVPVRMSSPHAPSGGMPAGHSHGEHKH